MRRTLSIGFLASALVASACFDKLNPEVGEPQAPGTAQDVGDLRVTLRSLQFKAPDDVLGLRTSLPKYASIQLEMENTSGEDILVPSVEVHCGDRVVPGHAGFPDNNGWIKAGKTVKTDFTANVTREECPAPVVHVSPMDFKLGGKVAVWNASP